MKINNYLGLILFGSLIFSCQNEKVKTKDTIEKLSIGFESLQDSTRTKTWWFHGETETTKEGITADLEAFKKAGIGGVVYYDQVHGKAEKADSGFSAHWWEMLRFSAEEAKRVGLTFELNISNGFVAGGKWITPEFGMQRLVATDTIIEGDRFFEGVLNKPTSSKYKYANDVAVLAFPVPLNEGENTRSIPFNLSSNRSQSFDELFQQREKLLVIPPHPKGDSIVIDIDFVKEFTARSISYEVGAKGKATTSATNVPGPPSESFVGTGYRILPNLGELEVSSDGVNFQVVCSLKPIYKAHENWRQKTISFSPVKGRYYRLKLHDWWEEQDPRPAMQLGNVFLSSDAKIDQWEEKAALYSEYIEKDQTPDYHPQEIIPLSSIINLTDQMDTSGVLRWQIPKGKWRVLRFAHVPTGGSSKHGRKNLMGLECDKLSSKAARAHWGGYVKPILDSLRASGSGIIEGITMDSHEAGSQNWTAQFITEFIDRRGYDPTLYLPAMCGYVVDNVAETQGFLQDVRRNIADMIADNYYGTFEKLCQEEGLVFTAQATGNALCIVADPIHAKSKVSKPQGEFWPIHPDGNYDIKESSSSAHLYGKLIASAEAYTDAKYSHSLADLKSLADYAYAFGINEFVICASSYQPWLDKIPGSTGGGRHYCVNRNNTWWPYSKDFWDYQSRMAYVMRQGKPKADLCIYLGDNAPVKILTYRLPKLPGGFDFDAFTTDALLHRMTVVDGRIFLPDGVNYQLMILPQDGELTFQALTQIANLVYQGAKIYGPRPHYSGSKVAQNEKEFIALVRKVWGDEASSDIGSNTYGKGTVYWGISLNDAIKQASIKPDVAMKEHDTQSAKIYFAHRQLLDGEFYFLHNHKQQSEINEFTFATPYKTAQLWHPQTGERYRIPIVSDDESSLTIFLKMLPMESYLIVLSDDTEDTSLPLAPWFATTEKSEIGNPWKVKFDTRMGGPDETIILNKLEPWSAFEDDRIKFYSGTAVYHNKFEVDTIDSSTRYYIELDNPLFAAAIYLNGQYAGDVWCAPWQCDVTKLLRVGENNLELHVAGSLINRMVGDASLPLNQRVTYCYPEIVNPTDTLLSSGLLGKGCYLKRVNYVSFIDGM